VQTNGEIQTNATAKQTMQWQNATDYNINTKDIQNLGNIGFERVGFIGEVWEMIVPGGVQKKLNICQCN